MHRLHWHPPRGIRSGSPDDVWLGSGSFGILHFHVRPAGAFLCGEKYINQDPSEILRPAPYRPDSLERDIKKYDLQMAQMKDTEKREKYRILR